MGTSPRAPLVLLMLGLAAPAALVGVVLPTEVHAQQAVFASPVVEMVGGGEIIANGKTVAVHFVAYNLKGKPMSGLTGKVDGELGSAPIVEINPGLYQAQLKPDAIDQRKRMEITFSGKTEAREKIDRTYMVSVAPAVKSAVKVSANPPRLTLGQDPSATVTVEVQGNTDGADIALLVSAGEIRNVTNMGNGKFVAQYVPPQQQFPQYALITAVDKRNPGKAVGTHLYQLVGKANFPVVGKPNSAIIMQVGPQEFGPVQSDATGKAQVPVVVPPGVPTATVISITNGQRTEAPLDLQVPPSKTIQFFPMSSSVPSDPGKKIPLRAWVARANGDAAANADVSFTVSAGTVGPAEHVGEGQYTAAWTPPSGNTAATATLQVTVNRNGTPFTDSMNVALSPVRAQKVSLSAEPPDLAPGDAGFQIFAKARGPADQPLSGRNLVIDALGATTSGATRDLGGGDYQASFAATSGQSAHVAVAVGAPPTNNPVHRLMMLPVTGQVTPGGNAAERVAVVSVDRYGYPVANVDVELKLLTGDGSFPTTVNTGAQGVAFVSYTSGNMAGWVSVQGRAAGHVGTAGFIQAPDTVKPIPAPVSNKDGVAKLHRAWADSIGVVSLARGGSGGGTVVAAPVSLPTAAGPVARVSATADPGSVAAGGSVTLRIKPVDANGQPASVGDFVFMASQGTVSSATPSGDGGYLATLTVPSDASGEVMISVGAASGAVATMLKVPVSGAAVAAVGAWGQPAAAQPAAEPAKEPVAEPAPVEEPKKEKKEKAPKEAREKGDHPWLHAQAGYLGGTYNYYQAAVQTGGFLYDNPITVGFDQADKAGTFGMQLNARAWLPMLEYVGADIGFKGSRWQISLPEGFDAPIADGLNNIHAKALGRYFFDIEQVRLSVGGGIGMQFNDFLYFSVDRATTTDGTDKPEYNQLWTTGMTYNFEGGVEVDDFFWAQGGYEMGLTDYSALYSDRMYLELGWAFIDNMYVFGNFDRMHRSTKVYYGESKEYVGNLEDSHLRFGGGLGYQF